MPAELPYERDVDGAAAERYREERRAMERRARIRTEMHRVAGAGPGGRRERGAPPLTERRSARFDLSEIERLQRTADALGVSVPTLLRAAALVLAARQEGRL